MMKKIVPFNNVLEFSTDVKEITAISLEHEISKYPDMISGIFYISGEYKITEGLLDKEKFNFELPFDIALSNNYVLDTLVVDIDDFRYDLISDKSLKVNIDLYIDGEVEEPLPRTESNESIDFLDRVEALEEPEEAIELDLSYVEESQKEEVSDELEEYEDTKEDIDIIEPERIELLKEMLTTKEEKMPTDININNENENETMNILENKEEENYVTYRVYKVTETDTNDTILTKYNITKELLAEYNNIETINKGDKLIIPTNEK